MTRNFKLLAVLAALSLGGFHGAAAVEAAEAVGAAPAAAARQASAIVDPGYRLGAGDKIRLITFGEESLTGEFQVSGVGTVSLPLIGDMRATNLTTSEFQTAVETALRGRYLKDPHVSVQVLTYRPFYILGEVNKPGEYPYTDGLTVMNAIATANGFTYRASKKQVLIKRAGDTAERPVQLSPSATVSPGDTIRVKERYF